MDYFWLFGNSRNNFFGVVAPPYAAAELPGNVCRRVGRGYHFPGIIREPDFFHLEDECEEDILADEAQWEAQFVATQEGLQRMAARVRGAIQAGRTSILAYTQSL